ncbi:hypothetical protein [Brasilonema sp. UFV-L1]|uniref:hypothetical protein n=1 Tax=Brasilonema sp. UFV-L1 TaxID=2234130 RepID=UPI00145EBEC9|nr:hypothetical protein [Brasilonema sp. UFV-L1]NMG05784.1 hypothetical protein [Brasilonema sp. UFV-L1]
MLNPIFNQICRIFFSLSAKTTLTGLSLLLLTLSSGCNQKAQEKVQLEITSVEPAGGNGLYNVSGSTNLPDSSLIAVAAVRYLIPIGRQQAGVLNDEANNNRSILARQIVEVKQGQWQANLNLWQVAPDGRFQEAWQAYQKQMKLRPDSNVTFLATFERGEQLRKSNLQLEGKQLRFTNEGELYLQANQTSPISLPVGKTTPPREKPQELNYILGKPSVIQIKTPALSSNTSFLRSAKFRQTNAPLKPSEFLR